MNFVDSFFFFKSQSKDYKTKKENRKVLEFLVLVMYFSTIFKIAPPPSTHMEKTICLSFLCFKE